MVKSKFGSLAKLPRDQKCHFLIGPVSSWFMPNTTDIWAQAKACDKSNVSQSNDDTSMASDNLNREDNASLSFFVYGSIGCFCYGEIYHRTSVGGNQERDTNNVSALVKRLIAFREDNSRVSCIRFQKRSPYPIVVALTENGSLVIHDCLKGVNLIQYNKAEILNKYLGLTDLETNSPGDQSAKRVKFAVTRQINSVVWPNYENIILGISLTKEKSCCLLRLNLRDVVSAQTGIESSLSRDIFVEKSEKIELDLGSYDASICLLESVMLDDSTTLIAIAMDDGRIIVIKYNLIQGQCKRIIKFNKHRDQVCSMSLNVDDQKKYPLGLLCSVDREGWTFIWDIENEFFFAEYKAIFDTCGGGDNQKSSGARINWFALSLIRCPESKYHLAISNQTSGVTILKLPENKRSKTRLWDNKKQQALEQSSIKHSALIFNMEYEPMTNTLITSSLDGNHVLWKFQNHANNQEMMNARPQCLIPAMLNNAKVHMIRSNPIKEDFVCLALGKAGLRFFKISDKTMNCRFDMSPSCSLLSRKVSKANLTLTSISWHPDHEYRLALGTLEGSIYRADITPRKASLVEATYQTVQEIDKGDEMTKARSSSMTMNVDEIFEVEYEPPVRQDTTTKAQQIKRNPRPKTDGIYSLCWGPNPASPQDVSKYAIYAVGSITHRLFIMYGSKDSSDKLTNYLDEFRDVSLPEANGKASEVSWKSSMDLMALGTIDGRIFIVSYLDESHEGRSHRKLFKKIAVIQSCEILGQSFIQCLAWHPTKDSEDPHYYYLAAAANESPAFIFNLKESILVDEVKRQLKLEQSKFAGPEQGHSSNSELSTDNMLDSVTVLSAYVNKLHAHKKAITDMAWSPYISTQLATVSFDRTSYVWSIDGSFMEARLMSKFSARDRLFTVDWSLNDPDLIFTSGHDNTIWAWRPSENLVKSDD